jgi:alanyl-tRNA synthetase
MAKPRDAHAIRTAFLDFFAERGHTRVASSPLVPFNDPTLLFVNAGMVQFKDVFTGRDKRDYVRATSAQRCLRAGGKHNDLDNVGFTPRHHTLFEMLGNFSFGDYFKQDAIAWAWEFLTKTLELPANKLVVSVFNGEGDDAPFDQEAYDLWAEIVPRDRIYAFHAKENFWQMGDTGPCGPCTEIHIFLGEGDAPGTASEKGKGPAYEDRAYMELWNLVFMQYEKHPGGSMTKLPAPSVDTGAGLERLAAVFEGVGSNYETSLLAPLVDRAKWLAGVSGPQGEREASFRVIADHARATAFLIADGVTPEKTKREYVLRRIMRRAIRHGTLVGLDQPFFHVVCDEVVDRFGDAYPELRDARAAIADAVQIEEQVFRRTLDRGLKMVEATLASLPADATAFPIEPAAKLYDTYGFPIDLTRVIADEHKLHLDEDAVAEYVRTQLQGVSEDGPLGGGGQRIEDIYFALAQEFGPTNFLGYGNIDASATLRAIVRDGVRVAAATVGDTIEVIFDRTPFYAESGGQIGDTGRLEISSNYGPVTLLRVTDTQKPTGGLIVHHAVVERGSVRAGESMRLSVDVDRRDAIRRNHSATHMLHHALRELLGRHVTQKGSLVAPDRLRFDFSHPRPVTREELQDIEQYVNTMVLANAPTGTNEMRLAEAKQAGAIGLFGEKYGEQVRVVTIAGDSVELCGGTHVARAGDVGLFKIISETGIAQGVRRLEAVTGTGAIAWVQHTASIVEQAAAQLHARDADDVLVRLAKLQDELRNKDRQVAQLERKLATGGSTGGADEVTVVAGVKLLVRKLGVADPKVMRDAADTLRDRLGSGVVVLAAERDGKANLLVAVTKDLGGKVHAGNLVGALAGHVGGRGGGRPDLAQAGGPNVAGLDAVVADAPKQLAAMLGQ